MEEHKEQGGSEEQNGITVVPPDFLKVINP
jgi:hypothetical protein